MAHYAKIQDGIVIKVIVAEPEYFDDFIDDSPGNWIKTSYNTRGNVHLDEGTPLRKNFAGVGYSYDLAMDAFIEPSPFPSWELDSDTGLWDPPTPHPADGKYYWDEPTEAWIAE